MPSSVVEIRIEVQGNIVRIEHKPAAPGLTIAQVEDLSRLMHDAAERLEVNLSDDLPKPLSEKLDPPIPQVFRGGVKLAGRFYQMICESLPRLAQEIRRLAH